MGLLDWLKRKQAGDDSAVLTFDKGEDEFAGLNLHQVLDAHMAWRTRLQDVLKGTSTEVLEVRQIAPDNLCVLGKWLYGPGKQQFGELPEYEVLRTIHGQFHHTAGRILADSKKGNQDAAERLLRGEFRTLSDQIQLALVRLWAARK